MIYKKDGLLSEPLFHGCLLNSSELDYLIRCLCNLLIKKHFFLVYKDTINTADMRSGKAI